MVVRKGKDLGFTWQCGRCGKWNFREAQSCWKCHEAKTEPTPRKRKSKKETPNAGT